MLSNILNAAVLAKSAVAVTLVASVATSAVGGTDGVSIEHAKEVLHVAAALRQPSADLDALVAECLARYEALMGAKTESDQNSRVATNTASEACHRAIETSGLASTDFWAKFGPKKGESTKTETTKPQTTTSAQSKPVSPAPVSPAPSASPEKPAPRDTAQLALLVRACVERYQAAKTASPTGADKERAAASEACGSAIRASGLSQVDFWSKFGPMFKEGDPKPTTRPSTSELGPLVKDCLAKYTAVQTATDREAAGRLASDACRRAIETSGLSSSDFWSRFGPKTGQPAPEKKSNAATATPRVDTKALGDDLLVKDCIARYASLSSLKNASPKVSSAARDATIASCEKAIARSGLTSNEFWARYHPASSPTPKPDPKPGSNTVNSTKRPDAPATELVKDCLYLRAALTSTANQDQAKRTSDACNKAIVESKLTPPDFWARFGVTTTK